MTTTTRVAPRPPFSVRRPRPRYDEEVFCRFVLDNLQGLFEGRTRVDRPQAGALYQDRTWVRSPADADDAMGDFLFRMVDRGWWRRYDPAQGSLRQFAVRYADVFLRSWAATRARRKTSRAAMHSRVFRRLEASEWTPRPARAEVAALIQSIRVRVSPELDETMDAVMCCGGDTRRAALVLGVSREVVSSRLCRIRERVAETGLPDRALISDI